jgi:beta-lactamase class A
LRTRTPFSAFRWLSLVFVLLGVVLFTLQLVSFSRIWANFPSGLTIAGVPVGQLDRQQAAERLLEAYSIPVELHYDNAVIQMSPSVVGFELDLESMLAAADQERTRLPFWAAFWDYLWGSPGTQTDIPLRATYSTERLRAYLTDEIAVRYDHPPTPALPVTGTVNFQPGVAGTSLDLDRSVTLIDSALKSISQRVVDLPLQHTNPTRPAFQNLEILLRQTIDLAKFDGVIGIYLKDLQNAQEMYLLEKGGSLITNPPDVAFSAASTIKIPILVATLKRTDDNPNPDVINQIKEMIGKSSNPPADWLMQKVIDPARGPLELTDDLHALGLQNTFMGGYFYPGAPLLAHIKTLANSRPDVTTDPDPYSQTTPAEMGFLLESIYQCAQYGGGVLVAVFPGQITQPKCQDMINYLLLDHNAVLIQGGVPDGTKVAHKHGWVTDPYGVIHDMSDAALVYTPGGNYILAIFLYHPTQLVWDTASKLVSDLSRAVYNFYNLPAQ